MKAQSKHDESIHHTLTAIATSISPRLSDLFSKLIERPEDVGESLSELKYCFAMKASPACTKVFDHTKVFECYDCRESTSSVLCQDCFIHGDHVGHVYRDIISERGCCDCGNQEAWDKNGFCSSHSLKQSTHKLHTEPEIQQKTKFIQEMQFLLYLLFLAVHSKEQFAKKLTQQNYEDILLSFLKKINENNFSVKQATAELFLSSFGPEYPKISESFSREKNLMGIFFLIPSAYFINQFIDLTYEIFIIEQFKLEVIKRYISNVNNPDQLTPIEKKLNDIQFQYISSVKGLAKLASSNQIKPIWPTYKPFKNFNEASQQFQAALADLHYAIRMKGCKEYFIFHFKQLNAGGMAYFTELHNAMYHKDLQQIYLKTMVRMIKVIKEETKLIQKCLRELYQSINKHYNYNRMYNLNEKQFAIFIMILVKGNLLKIRQKYFFSDFLLMIGQTIASFKQKLQILIENMLSYERYQFTGPFRKNTTNNQLISQLSGNNYPDYQEKLLVESLDLIYKKVLVLFYSHYQSENHSEINIFMKKTLKIYNQLKQQKNFFYFEVLGVVKLIQNLMTVSKINLDILIVSKVLDFDVKQQIIQFYKGVLLLYPKHSLKQLKDLMKYLLFDEACFKQFLEQCIKVEKDVVLFNDKQKQIHVLRHDYISLRQFTFVKVFAKNHTEDLLIKIYQNNTLKAYEIIFNEDISIMMTMYALQLNMIHQNIRNYLRQEEAKKNEMKKTIDAEITLSKRIEEEQRNKMSIAEHQNLIMKIQYLNSINDQCNNKYKKQTQNMDNMFIDYVFQGIKNLIEIYQRIPNAHIKDYMKEINKQYDIQRKLKKSIKYQELYNDFIEMIKSTEEIEKQQQNHHKIQQNEEKNKKEKYLKVKEKKMQQMQEKQNLAKVKFKQEIAELEEDHINQNEVTNACIICKEDDGQLFYMVLLKESNLFETLLMGESGQHLTFRCCRHQIHEHCLYQSQKDLQIIRCFLCKAQASIILPIIHLHTHFQREESAKMISQCFSAINDFLIIQNFQEQSPNNQGLTIQKEKTIQSVQSLVYSSIIKEIIFYALSNPIFYSRKIAPCHLEFLSFLKIINYQHHQEQNIFEKTTRNKLQQSKQKNIFEENLKIVMKILWKSLLNDKNVHSKLNEQLSALQQFPSQWNQSLLIYSECLLTNNSQQFLKVIEVEEIVKKLILPQIPQDLFEFHLKIQKCALCSDLTTAMARCLVCGWQSCIKCIQKVREHVKINHLENGGLIRTDNGCMIYYVNGQLVQEDRSLYEDYLGESLSRYDKLKAKTYMCNKQKLKKIRKAIIQCRASQLLGQ